jgi:hypothetical protein
VMWNKLTIKLHLNESIWLFLIDFNHFSIFTHFFYNYVK